MNCDLFAHGVSKANNCIPPSFFWMVYVQRVANPGSNEKIKSFD